jgi:hypothetical protein
MPTGAVVQSATFGIEQRAPGSGEMVNIYRITEAWSESDAPSWDTFADNYDSSVIWASFSAMDGMRTVDVSDLVAAWVDGAVPNYGMMLTNDPGEALDEYLSSDYSRDHPWLEVCYVEP